MPRGRSLKVEVREYSNPRRPNDRWIVYWPNETPGRARRSKRFQKKIDAKAFAEQKQIDIHNKGAEGGAVHSDAVEEAKWAMKTLEPYGVSIREVVDAYIERQDQIAKSVAVRVAVEEFLGVKERNGASHRYLRDIRSRLNRFSDEFGGEVVCDLTARALARWLEQLDLGPTSRNNYRRNLGVFFNWAKRLGYCRENPAKLVERAKKKPEPVKIFSAEELRIILIHSPEDLVPVLAIGAFAGLRVAEIAGLDWSEIKIDKGLIEVAAENAKTASRRFVPLEPVLRSWLEPLKCVTGSVIPRNVEKRLTAYRKLLAEEEKSENGVVTRPAVLWRDNGLRHSYGSYAIAREESADRVALWMGHTSAAVTFQHYQERATKEEAEAWFGVRRDAGGSSGFVGAAV